MGTILEDDSSAARSQAGQSWRLRSSSRSGAPHRSDLKGSASADTNSIRSTRPKSNASARARPPGSPSLAASLSRTPKHCRANHAEAHARWCHRGHREAYQLRNRAHQCDNVDRGHKMESSRRVFISGQKLGSSGMKHELGRRSAIEPVSDHMKIDGHVGRCHPQGGARMMRPTLSLSWSPTPRLSSPG